MSDKVGRQGSQGTPETTIMACQESLEILQPPATKYLRGWRLATVILSLYLGAFVMALDTNIINVAVPKIASEFHTLEDVAWYGSAYLLTVTAFQPAFGNLYKFFDIENTYRSCIVVFELGSILCAAARNSSMFICGRAVAGLGAAGILQGALAVIGTVVELQKRALYTGIVISVFVVTVCIGPILGGVFTTHATWRWCFWINVPLGAVVLVLLFMFLRIEDTDSQTRKLPLRRKLDHMDPLGCLVFIGAICCLLLALQWGGQSRPWKSATIIGLLIGSGLLISVFLYIQAKLGDRATIPLRVLRQRSILAGAGVLFSLGATTYVICFYIPFWFQAVKGVDAMTSGIRQIPLLIPQMLALILTGAAVSTWGYYVPYMVVGDLIGICGVALLTRLTTTSTTVYWAASLVVTGLGLGMAMQLPYTAVQVVLSQDDVPTGNAIAVFAWQLGGAISIAIGQTITLGTFVNRIPHDFPDGLAATTIATGPSSSLHAALSPQDLSLLRATWNLAVTRTMFLALAMTCVAVPCTLAMEWLNAKEIAETRAAASNRSQEEKAGA